MSPVPACPSPSALWCGPLFSPHIPEPHRRSLISFIEQLNLDEPHVFLSTSGSTLVPGAPRRWVALSHRALWAAAVQINRHIKCQPSDIIYNTLPLYHIGGFMARVRALQSGAHLIEHPAEKRWDPCAFVQILGGNKVSVTSLVPTQIFDVVGQNLASPASLRCVFVGGGALSPALYRRARLLGWPVLTTYGMSECASQVATASLENLERQEYPLLKILPHVQLRTSETGCLIITGESLMSGVILQSDEGQCVYEPLKEGQVVTSDMAEILPEGELRILGRADDMVKVRGKNIFLSTLEGLLEDIKHQHGFYEEGVLVARPHERSEHEVGAVFLKKDRARTQEIREIMKDFNAQTRSYEHISFVSFVDRIPRTALGKLMRKSIVDAEDDQTLSINL